MKTSFKILLFLCVLLIFMTTPVNAETTYVPATHVSSLDSSDDMSAGPFDIGFNFPFYNVDQTQFNVTTNGIVSFEGANTVFSNNELPSSSYDYPSIFPFWDDLHPSYSSNTDGFILYKKINASEYDNPYASDVLVIQWTNYGYFNSDLVMGTFQVHMVSDGDILFNYNNLVSDRSYGGSATIGIQENGTGEYVQHSYYADAGIRSGKALNFTYEGGTSYIKQGVSTEHFWDLMLYKEDTVQPPGIPQNPSPSVGSTVSTNPSLSWDAVDNANNYSVIVSSSYDLSSPHYSETISNNSTTVSGLSEDTTYYWQVIARNNGGDSPSELWNFTTDLPPKFNSTPEAFFINNDGTSRDVNTNFTFAYSGKNISLWTKLDNESAANVIADFSHITGNSGSTHPFEYQGNGVFTLMNYSMPDNDTGVYYISINAITDTGFNNTVCPVMLNFNPQSNITGLNNSNTTDWTTIEDPTNVSNLTFEANDSNDNVIGSLEFTETVNLCDIEFAQRLQQFGKYMNFTTAQASLDSANLSRLNVSTSLTMYGLGSFDNQPGILLDGQPILKAGNTSSESVSGLEWDAENGTLTFSVNHWSTYTADGEAPEVTAISPKEKRVKVGDTLEMNVSVKDTSGISSVVVNVSSINDTVNEAVLTNVSGYWVNNSIMVDTDAEDTYYLNINATDVLGNYNNTVNLSVIRDDTVKADDDKKSSSGGRSSVGPSMPLEDVEGTDSGIKRVLAGSNVKYDFSDGEGPVLGISFDAKDDKGTVVAKVQALKDKPDDVDDPIGNSYQLMSITVGSEGTISDDNADDILIEFKVSKEWIEENNIDPSTIRMTRFYDGEWEDLPSNQVGEDDGYLHFNAETPGFSIFSIVGDKVKEEAVEEELATEQQPPAEEVDEPASETEDESAQTPGFTAIFAVALIAGAALVMRKQN